MFSIISNLDVFGRLCSSIITTFVYQLIDNSIFPYISSADIIDETINVTMATNNDII